MDIQQMKNFLILCETLNFRKAAEQINIVQTGFEQAIQLLEREVGALLFNRSNRSVVLTEAGGILSKGNEEDIAGSAKSHDQNRAVCIPARPGK